MARRSLLRDNFGSIEAAIDLLTVSPIAPIAEILTPSFQILIHGGPFQIETEDEATLANGLRLILCKLPTSFGERFDLDAAFIQSMIADWNPDIQLSRMLVPKHDEQWGFYELHLPGNPNRMPVVRVFFFPGQDALSDVDLLDYPWLAHEIAHALLFQNPKLFPTRFSPLFEKTMRTLTLRSVADRGLAGSIARTGLEEMRKYWNPAQDQGNWAHEIAMDIIALWTCGPAYVAAFADEVEKLNLDLFMIGSVHPPYIVRIAAMVHACFLTNTPAHGKELEILSNLQSQKSPNEVLRLATDEMVVSAVEAGLAVCEDLQLRDWRYFDTGGQGALKRNAPELGVAILLEASRIRSRSRETDYLNWERNIISEISAQLAKQ